MRAVFLMHNKLLRVHVCNVNPNFYTRAGRLTYTIFVVFCAHQIKGSDCKSKPAKGPVAILSGISLINYFEQFFFHFLGDFLRDHKDS